MTFKLRVPHVDLDRAVLGSALLAVSFGPAAFAGWKWWHATEGADRYFLVAITVVAEVLLAWSVWSFVQARRSGHSARAVFIIPAACLLAALSGVMLYQPVSQAVAARFPAPVVPSTVEAEARERLAQTHLDRVENAAASGDELRLQLALAAAGGDLTQWGFDGDLGGETAAAYTAVAQALDRVSFNATVTRAKADDAKTRRAAWRRWVIAGVAVILLIETFGRWLFLGVAHGRGDAKPQQAPARVPDDYDRDAPIEELRGWWPARKDGSAPGPAPARHHWSRRVGASGREGWYLKAYRRADLRLVHSA